MRKTLWTIFITLLTVYLTSCASLNEWSAKRDKRIYNSYANQDFVKWYQSKFLPKIEELRKSSSYELHTIEKVNSEFLGVKINYTEETNNNYHHYYTNVHNNTLNWYKQYVQQQKGLIQGYKPALTKAIIRTGLLRMVERDRLRNCNFERMFIAKVNNQLNSGFIDVTCYYPDPIITGRDFNSTFGWIAVVEAKILRQILDRLPNSLLMETKINY